MGRRVIRPFPSLTYPFPYRYRSQLRPPSFPTYPLPSNLYRLQVPFSTSPSVFCFDTLTSSRAVQGLSSSLINSIQYSPPRLRRQRSGFLQSCARRLTARGRAHPHRARLDDLTGRLDPADDEKLRVFVCVLCVSLASVKNRSRV